MHPLSVGYSHNCSNTPGRGSPYMWPLAWKAKMHSASIPYGTNSPYSEADGVDWYRLDLNWHRQDLYVDESTTTTTLHRGGLLVFLTRVAGKGIISCSKTEGVPAGNIRPDWFLDRRGGGQIDLQYLGKEHIYYRGRPRLARKWRKSDFQDQVFTVSTDEYLNENRTRFPLTINIPGEGGVNDSLKSWYDHVPLDVDDLSPFLLEQEYTGDCPVNHPSGRPGSSTTPIPSALEKDVNAFRTVLWSGSPYAPTNTTTEAPTAAPSGPADGFVCSVCQHVYDADRDGNGVPFEDLPETWKCPICGARKSAYKKISASSGAEVWAHVEPLLEV